jgi:hypothetical protein
MSFQIKIGSRAQVFHGVAEQTSSGLRKKDLRRVKKHGEYRIRTVEELKKSSKRSKESKDWSNAVKKARKELVSQGVISKDEFVPLLKKKSTKLTLAENKKGMKLYKLAKSFCEK